MPNAVEDSGTRVLTVREPKNNEHDKKSPKHSIRYCYQHFILPVNTYDKSVI